MNDSSHLALELVKWRILGKPYDKWRAIIAEMGDSDTNFLRALREVHNIFIDKAENPMLYVVQDTQQMRLFTETGVSPTMLQILLTSKVIALSEQEATERFEKLMKENQVE